jgi:hypothetical protein
MSDDDKPYLSELYTLRTVWALVFGVGGILLIAVLTLSGGTSISLETLILIGAAIVMLIGLVYFELTD